MHFDMQQMKHDYVLNICLTYFGRDKLEDDDDYLNLI